MQSILTINGGSSSIKFAFYQAGEPLKRELYGKVDRIGLSGTNLTFHDVDGKPPASRKLDAADHKSAANSARLARSPGRILRRSKPLATGWSMA